MENKIEMGGARVGERRRDRERYTFLKWKTNCHIDTSDLTSMYVLGVKKRKLDISVPHFPDRGNLEKKRKKL